MNIGPMALGVVFHVGLHYGGVWDWLGCPSRGVTLPERNHGPTWIGMYHFSGDRAGGLHTPGMILVHVYVMFM